VKQGEGQLPLSLDHITNYARLPINEMGYKLRHHLLTWLGRLIYKRKKPNRPQKARSDKKHQKIIKISSALGITLITPSIKKNQKVSVVPNNLSYGVQLDGGPQPSGCKYQPSFWTMLALTPDKV